MSPETRRRAVERLPKGAGREVALQLLERLERVERDRDEAVRLLREFRGELDVRSRERDDAYEFTSDAEWALHLSCEIGRVDVLTEEEEDPRELAVDTEITCRRCWKHRRCGRPLQVPWVGILGTSWPVPERSGRRWHSSGQRLTW